MKTPTPPNKLYDGETDASPDLDWQDFTVIAVVLVAFVCALGAALW